MSEKLKLEVVFAAIDKFIRPVKAITAAAKAASKEFNENAERIKELDRTMGKIDSFTKVQKDAAITANSIKSTANQITALKEAISKAGVPTEAMSREMERLKNKSTELGERTERLRKHEIDLRTALQMANVDTNNLAGARQHLAEASAAATMSSHRLQSALDVENKKMQRLHAAQADLAKAKETAGKLAMRGAGLMAGGVAVGVPVAKTTKDFADFETAMLGVRRQMDGARDENGKVTKTYWEMADAIKAMAEQPAIGKTAEEIAKIVEGGARMGIQGKQNLLIFADTAAVMATAFDLPVDQLGEDIGKISQLYKVPIADIKALGDTINWLDDNALAKGGDIIDVMKRIAGTADMVKMNFREAAALGSTFLSLGANPEVAASASNAMMRELSIANMQSKRFKEGMAMLGLDGKTVQRSMSTDATGTIIKVLEKIKSLAGDKQLEAATRLFGKEYGDDAAKLASNLDEYRKQLKLVNKEKAKGSMQREADSRGDTINARLAAGKNAMSNLSSDLGKLLAPALVATLETTLAIVQGIRNWAKENPGFASGLMTVVKYLAIALTVVGALTMAAGAILIPLAALKFSMLTLGLTGSGALGMIGTALATVGRAMLLNPIGLTLTGIALAAGLIYANWDKLGPWLTRMIKDIKTGFGDLVAWVVGLPGRMVEAGTAMVDGIIRGIQSRWQALKDTITGLGGASIDWLKEKLGIHSPSRVFAQLGAYTMQGFEQGLLGGAGGPLSAMGDAARKLAAIGAGVVIGAAPMGAGAATARAGGDTYHITIEGSAGEDDEALVRKLEGMLERIQMKKNAQARSRLRDTE